MPQDLTSYIRLPGIFKKLDQLRVKEDSAINLVLKYMGDGQCLLQSITISAD